MDCGIFQGFIKYFKGFTCLRVTSAFIVVCVPVNLCFYITATAARQPLSWQPGGNPPFMEIRYDSLV